MNPHVPDRPIEPEYGGPDYEHAYEESGPRTVVCSQCHKERDADDCDYDDVCLVCLGEKEESPTLQPTPEIVSVVSILKQINRRFGITK